MNKYSVTTDIEKAFLLVELHEDNRDVARFFGFENPNDPTSQFSSYRFGIVYLVTSATRSFTCHNFETYKFLSFPLHIFKKEWFVC